MFGRHRILKKIEKLDAEKDHYQIAYLSGFHEFPFESTRALELAFLRTYAIASIGNLLDHTKEFEKHTQKRYDDTDLLLSEIIENGYDSERGQRAIARMNAIHSRFRISNEDFLYVLSTFFFEPKRFIDKYGYRKLTAKEVKASFIFWQEIGLRMGIQDIPKTVEAFEVFNQQYEQTKFRFTKGGRRVADYTLNLFLSWYLPRFLFPLARPFVLAMLDEPLLNALQYKKAPLPIRILVASIFKLRASLLRFLPARKTPKLHTTNRIPPTYPDGYKIEELGPTEKKKH